MKNKKVLWALLMSPVMLCAFSGLVTAQTIRVNSAGPAYTDAASNVWSADTGFNTGTAKNWTTTIAGTNDPALYLTERWDPPTAPEMTYSFNVPNGTYTVRLHFAEKWAPAFAVGGRVFDVNIQGALVFDNLDVFAQAGARTALIKSATATVTNGTLTIAFVHQVDDPFVDALEIISQTPQGSVATVAEYEYDELGRLKTVVTAEIGTVYTLDPAGNRTLVTSTAGHGLPSFVSVPPSNYTQTYTVTWGNSTGSAPPDSYTYALYEATNPSFAGQTSLYSASGSGRSFTVNSKPYGTYYYRARVCEASGCGPHRAAPAPIVVQPPPPPGVPGTMTVPATDLDGVYDLSWGASSGAIAEFPLTYQLYEATASNFSNQVQVYSGTTASAHLTGRATGTYYYRVRACNGPSCSGYSTGPNSMVVTLTPDMPGVATVPATYTNVGSYTVSWTASGGIVPVLRYELLESVAFGGESLIYSGLNLSFPISGRGNNTYSYRLRACNAGCSAYTATQGNGAVVMVDTVAPTPPASLSRTQQTYLNWSGGSTDSGGGGAGSGVDRWRVYRNGSLIATVLSPTVAYNDTAAPSNQTHTWTVRSVDRAGNESTTAATLTALVDTAPPSAPTGVSAVGTSSSTINISWTAAIDPNGGTVSGYFVYRNGANQQLASGTSFVDTGLVPSTTYTYAVTAYDSAGNVGPQSAPANGTTMVPPPGVPGALTITSPDLDGTYPISWGASTGTVTSYELYEATAANFLNETQVYAGTATSTTLSGRANGTYYYRVRACNGPSCSTYKPGDNPMVVSLTPGTPGAATVPATYINVGSYTVSWTAPGGTIPATRYELLENVAFGSESLIYNGPSTSFAVSGRADATYSYRLRACNGGCSAYTATQGNGAVIMVDTIAPTPPASLTRTQQTFLNWSGGSTDGGSGIDRWRVYRNGSLIATVLSPTVAYNDTAAPSNQTHTWTVRSVDRAGNESTTAATLTAFVDTLAPSAPTGVSAVGVDSQTINVTWNAAVDPSGGTVSGYFVYRNGANPQSVTATSLTDIGLAASTTYTYTVSAYDNAGNVGPLSAPVNGTTTAQIPTVPNPPANIGVSRPNGTPAGHPSYTVFWSPSGPPTAYYILDENGTQTNVGSATSKAYNKTGTGSFAYKVKACSATNVCSAWSQEVQYDVCIGPCQ